MTGYVRQEAANIVDGNVLTAEMLNNEFNALQTALDLSAGHKHDGTAAEGAAITKIGPVQEFVASGASLSPKLTGTYSLGTTLLRYTTGWFSGAVTATGGFTGYLSEVPTIKNYGAVCDGTTDDSAAIAAMETALGYIVFPKGNTYIAANMTILQPSTFHPGAAITIANGATVMLRGRHVHSCRQHIFKGLGEVKFQGNDDYASGATIYPEWWGEFPRNDDCSVIIQKMSDACSLLTEWHATFVGGLYELAQGVTFGRGAFIQGVSQTRRVVFYVSFADGDVMTFTDTAARVEGIQFEGITRTSGANIRFNGSSSILRDVMTGGFVGVHVAGNGCTIEGLARIGTGTESDALLVNTGQGTTILNMDVALNATNMVGVRILDGSAFVEVDGLIATGTAAYAIDVQSTGFIPSLSFRRIRCRNNTLAAVNIECSGTGSCQNVNIDGVQMGPGTIANSACVRLKNTGSGNMFGIMISNLNPRGGAYGIYAERTSTGSLNRVCVSTSDLTLPTSHLTSVGSGIGVILDPDTVLT